jgi:hypothetical protein
MRQCAHRQQLVPTVEVLRLSLLLLLLQWCGGTAGRAQLSSASYETNTSVVPLTSDDDDHFMRRMHNHAARLVEKILNYI